MIPLSELQEHLKTLSQNDWAKLFDILNEMEKPQDFGHLEGGGKGEDGFSTFPFWVSSKIVSKFFDTVHELKIIPAFDWGSWKEGQVILNNEKEDYDKLDIITLCKLITCIIRAERFCDGTLVSSFEDGTIQKIVRALKSKIIM